MSDLRPRDCEQCDCQQYQWDMASGMHRSEPPSRCRCGHPCSRHIFLSREARAALTDDSQEG
jgi:hypothetical protein